ncbi:metalloregulator ArsR/SmtB family transcription factor [Leptospira sp. 96542]|nr:metalloregulator ArsR/SmtB family transcription factor [Leptospira sp. 96542]
MSIYNLLVVDSLTLTFTALSDPTRRAIINQLKQGPSSVNDLVKPFSVSQQAISKHLAFLEKAKLIKKRKDGRQNICELNAKPLEDINLWVNQYQIFWEGALDRLDGMLNDFKKQKRNLSKVKLKNQNTRGR